MNYVGCKAACLLASGLGISSFYMNYVGCKGAGTVATQPFSVKFYMNYVGCKAYLIYFISGTWFSFI